MTKVSKGKDFFYWLEQGGILAAHLGLLLWIVHILSQGGEHSVLSLTLHFLGLALGGGLLIALCAWLAKRRYLRQCSDKK
ncbi:MAG: hypothetical protein OXB88_08530 [Bacteriovoracales bacterium]|nr:hypothetical protein [Bacteriovoracales bacterium]